MARKLETKKEKVLPFPIEKPDGIEAQKLIELQHEFDFKLNDLLLFWQRVAQADAIRITMNEEKVCLTKQNQVLKEKIHNFCECITCPAYPDIMKATDIPVVVDASLESIKYAKNLFSLK